jgi:ABC-type nitrate/sulfonate/bicarbonate transport system substrate-binding protein
MQLAHADVRVGALGRALRRYGLALALGVALVTAGCHVPGTSNSPAGGGQLTVGIVPGIETAPLVVAVDDGLFRQQGLSVTVKQFSSDAQVYSALQSGAVDVAAGDYTTFFNAIASPTTALPSGARLTLVMDGYDAGTGTMQVLTLPNSGISTPQELTDPGVKVGTPEPAVPCNPCQQGFPYNIETLAATSVLVGDNVAAGSVNFQGIPENNLLNALKNGRVKAILATDPVIIQAETELGAVEVFDACSGETANLPLSGYFSESAFASQHAAALLAFRTALTTAQSDAGMRSTVQSVLHSEDMTTQESALVNIGQYPTFVNVGQVQRVADLMYTSGMIINPISVQSLLLK